MSDSDEEDIIIATAGATATFASQYYLYHISKTSCHDSALSGAAYVEEVLNGHDKRCQENFRMEKHVFLRLCDILYTKGLLTDTDGVRLEEQLAMFMLTVGHNERNRIIQERFQHSGETVSRHFNNVLDAIVALSGDFFQPAGSSTPLEILEDDRFYPYFKDCVGAIDGTHIPALVGSKERGPFINRKVIVTQNVLVACSFDLQFQYVLAGWEGSATDSRILTSALTRVDKLHVPEGKYYVVDAGYANTPSFIAPFRGTRYHLKEYGVLESTNSKELFNLRHSSLRNAVERIIGILKKRFPILTLAPPYPFETQVKIVISCCILHNHIRREKTYDLIFNLEDFEGQQESEVVHNNGGVENISRKRIREMATEFRKSIADAMWSDYESSK